MERWRRRRVRRRRWEKKVASLTNRHGRSNFAFSLWRRRHRHQQQRRGVSQSLTTPRRLMVCLSKLSSVFFFKNLSFLFLSVFWWSSSWRNDGYLLTCSCRRPFGMRKKTCRWGRQSRSRSSSFSSLTHARTHATRWTREGKFSLYFSPRQRQSTRSAGGWRRSISFTLPHARDHAKPNFNNQPKSKL
jgi:hypothetical protein